ncbi:hypothetical protein DL768_001808 [Monosporascus sp. mg162]|nr:hypothetical protein DL768_001808 [Monosporascus sp. mg162]
MTQTRIITRDDESTSTVRSSSNLPGTTLSSTCIASGVKTESQITTATTSSTAVGTDNATVTLGTVVPTTIVIISTVLVAVTPTVEQTLTSTVSATTMIESADATRTVTECITAVETTTLVTTCQLGQTSPAPTAFSTRAEQPILTNSRDHAFTIRSVSSYTGSFVAATAAPAASGCGAGALTTKRNSIIGAQAYLHQRIPGKTYQVGFSYRVELAPGVRTSCGQVSGYFGSQQLPSLPTTAGALWKLFSTPIVAFNETAALELTYFLHTRTQGIYALLIDEVSVTEVDDNDSCSSTATSTPHPRTPPPGPTTATLIYQFRTGSAESGQNGVRLVVVYGDAPEDRPVVMESSVGPEGCSTSMATFCARHEGTVWSWQGFVTLGTQRIPRAASVKGTVSILVDNQLPSAVTS